MHLKLIFKSVKQKLTLTILKMKFMSTNMIAIILEHHLNLSISKKWLIIMLKYKVIQRHEINISTQRKSLLEKLTSCFSSNNCVSISQ